MIGKPHSQHRLRAFTFIEIIATLVVLGVLAAAAILLFPRSTAGLATEVDRVSTHLRHAQIRAQADIHQWQLVFTDSQTYSLGPIVNPGAGYTPAMIPGTNLTSRTLTPGVAAPVVAVRFDSWGRPLDATGIPLTADQTLVLTEGDRSATIVIHAETGLIP